MANIARFKIGATPEYLLSVNTPEYSSDPDCIVNPDVSALLTVPLKYWKRSGNTVLEMTAAEKTTLDAADKVKLDASKDTQATTFNITVAELVSALAILKIIKEADLTVALQGILKK